ncbi:bifunctional riboflavin kinase/FAD synthetase [Yeosuana sp. MJ-SS3]|uniref:Riboflavin biosynthesis protein n=1 Tax=Gilvirhabdus luticola TaxID=3079858 RepID=A0ABU3U8Q4_9FLAO|nr:bifunctional riboflavin kinase/FAD synthetase [Yeosuana sp. MJ-SS3]MDU8886783.1 bifunctional riboflavin kinase/FAD synthetase [Yeosuana sp. MJ-SS3]
MKIISNFNSFSPKNKTIATIGTFDGVHIGHQKIIQKLVQTAHKKHLNAVVLTFFPHPRMVLQKDANIKLINTINEKAQLFEKLGVDNLVVKKFTKQFSRLSAEDFVKQVLVDKLKIETIIIGYDHHFGRNRNANIDDLRAFGEIYSFDVEEISVQDINEVAVSSTKIRIALNEGDVQTANAFLGYNFMLTGIVVEGKGMGKNIGFPTANIFIEENYKLIPKQGVYIVQSEIEGKTIFGMMNIGKNPTLGDNEQSIEVHFFNFSKSLYKENIQVELIHRIRDEQKFESLESLKEQLKKDKQTSLDFIASNNA